MRMLVKKGFEQWAKQPKLMGPSSPTSQHLFFYMRPSLTSHLWAAVEQPHLNVDDINTNMPTSISAAIISSWKQCWSNLPPYEQIRLILDVPDDFFISTGTRKFDVPVSRLVCGQFLLTHAFLLLKTPPPPCTKCLVPLTIPHILLKCTISATLCIYLPHPSLSKLPSPILLSYSDFFPPRLLYSTPSLNSSLFPHPRRYP